MKKDLTRMLKAIVKNGLLEDRSEYDVEMLRDMYALNEMQAKELHGLIAQEMAAPFKGDRDASIKIMAADLAKKMRDGK